MVRPRRRTVENVQVVENGTGVLCRTRTDRNTGQTYRGQRGQTVKSMDRHTVENMDRQCENFGPSYCGKRDNGTDVLWNT